MQQKLLKTDYSLKSYDSEPDQMVWCPKRAAHCMTEALDAKRVIEAQQKDIMILNVFDYLLRNEKIRNSYLIQYWRQGDASYRREMFISG